jgi:nucleotide-binding universal stress UspA family protein
MAPTYIAGYDGSHGARAATRFAARMAAATGAEVIVAAVYPQAPELETSGGDEPLRRLSRDARQEADRLLREVDLPGVRTMAVAGGSPAEGLHRLAEDEGASLLAVGSARRPESGAGPGSVGERLLHGATCPVAVIPPGWSQARVTTVAVGYGGENSEAAVRAAERLAEQLGVQLLLVIGVYEPIVRSYLGQEPSYADSEVAEEFRRWQEREVGRVVEDMPHSFVAEAWFLTGSPAAALVEACRERVDLLVVGSRSYGPAHMVLAGSVARQVAGHAPCPVLVVPRSVGPWPAAGDGDGDGSDGGEGEGAGASG